MTRHRRLYRAMRETGLLGLISASSHLALLERGDAFGASPVPGSMPMT